jgi:putative zinc finger/helix-turn-helix YgiT family protein
MECDRCGGAMVVTFEDRPYTECGLSNVIILGAEVRRCACGEEEFVLPRIAELHRGIARCLVDKKARLIGEEIRFLRKVLGWSGTDFAKHIKVTPETVSRWENGRDPIGPTADVALRMFVVTMAPVENYPVDDFADISSTKTPQPTQVRVPARRQQEACAF